MSSRLGALAACLAALFAAPAAAARDVVFVANSEAGTVTLIDAASFQRLGELNVIPDGRAPDLLRDPQHSVSYPLVVAEAGENFAQDLDLSPDGRILYVSRGHLGDVAAFSLETGALLWRVPISGLRSDHMTISADGRRLYVSALTADRIEVVDTELRAVIGSIPMATWPHDSHLSHDGARIYNGSIGNVLLPDGADGRKALTVANAHSLEVERTIDFPDGIRPFVLADDDRLLYAQISYFHGFVEYDMEHGRHLRTVNLPVSDEARRLPREDYPLEAAHHGLALSGDEHTLCAAGTVSDYVVLVSRPELDVAAIIPVPDEPGWATTTPDGRYCFVSSRGTSANSVSVISYAERREITRVPVGDHPQHLLAVDLPEPVVRAGGFTPRLRLERSCSRRGRLLAEVAGAVDDVLGVEFKLGRRLVRRDAAAPFAAVLGRRTLARGRAEPLRAVVSLQDGSRVILERTRPRCAG